jgi:hypothetical protein
MAMLVAWRIGTQIGNRARVGGRNQPSKFDDASMALLGLLLGFTFGMSITRYDQRRLAVVGDSNAIGDFYTCAAMLKEPTRTNLQNLIRRYARIRFELTRGEFSDSDLENALKISNQLHKQMINLVAEALKDGTPAAVPLVNSLNAVSSNQAVRLSAYRDRLPISVMVLLFTGAVVTIVLIGREQGVAEISDIAGTLSFILMVSLVVYTTLDLNRPESGLIRTSQEPVERLVSSMLD